MRTIKEVAEELKVTPAAVYKRLRENGVELTELSPVKQGTKTLYPETVCEQIKIMFVDSKPTENNCELTIASEVVRIRETVNQLKEQLQEAETALETARAEAQAGKERIKWLEDQQKRDREQLEKEQERSAQLLAALQTAQENIKAAQVLQLAAMSKPGKLERLKAFLHIGGKRESVEVEGTNTVKEAKGEKDNGNR